MPNQGQTDETRVAKIKKNFTQQEDFVLEKDIFSNIFEKDIRRVYIYKKTERLAKAIHLITPAFATSPSLRNKLDSIAVGLVEAAILPPGATKEAFSKELLALSSVLAIAESGGLLSPMNATLIAHEAHALLGEVASYEEPRLFLDDSPTLADLSKQIGKEGRAVRKLLSPTSKVEGMYKGHLKDIKDNTERQGAILAVIRDKGTVYIKDISTIVREVSEKTIQRELQKLVHEGVVVRQGSRRWTAYSLSAN